MAVNYGSFGISTEVPSECRSGFGHQRTRSFTSDRNVADYLIPKRYIFSFISFTACCLAVSYNMNLSIAIVSMVDHTGNINNNTNESSIPSLKTENQKLEWDANAQGLSLAAVYYGQLASFIPGGRLAELLGGKKTLLASILLAAVASLLSPLAATCNIFAFVATRVAVGVGTGPVIPIVFYMLARWIPPQERSFHASFILSGYGVGSFLAVAISGSLCDSTFLGGWPAVFYVGGFCGFLWCLVCFFFMCESPHDHPHISVGELSYIIDGIGTHKKKEILSIPWKKMATSVPLWSLAIGFFGQFWLLGFFSTVHALYMGIVLSLPIVRTGVLSCLPHLLRAFATCIASYPVDLMLEKRFLTIGQVRKGATIFNTVVSCGAFFAITFVGHSVVSTTVLFVIGGMFGEFVTFGVCMAAIDIAPHLSGTVSGILNIVGVFPFFIIPALVGWMTNYENSIEEWKNVFYTTVGLVSLSTLIFVVFGDLRPQPWGVESSSDLEDDEAEHTKLIEE